MAIHSSILAWRIPWQRSLEGYNLWGHRVGHDWATKHTAQDSKWKVLTLIHALKMRPRHTEVRKWAKGHMTQKSSWGLSSSRLSPVHPRGNQSWIFIGRTDAETPDLWPPDVKNWLIWKFRPWCWEGLKAGGEGDDRGWDGWMASPTQWTWVWVNSRSWWRTGRPGMLQPMGSQELDTTERLNWTELMVCKTFVYRKQLRHSSRQKSLTLTLHIWRHSLCSSCWVPVSLHVLLQTELCRLNSHVEALIPSATVSADRAFKEVLKITWQHKGRTLLQYDQWPYKKGERHQYCLSLCPLRSEERPCEDAERKQHSATLGERSHQNQPLCPLDLRFPVSRTVRK